MNLLGTTQFCLTMCLLFLVYPGYGQQTIVRPRSEGTTYLDAANVMGGHNLSFYSAWALENYTERNEQFPTIGAMVGISGFLQFKGECAFHNFQTIGPLEGHLKLSVPGNGGFRFFNASFGGDIYLSTTQDTITATTDTAKPDYHAFFAAGIQADLDWLAIHKSLPIKTGFYAGLADTPHLLHRYQQIRIQASLEFKRIRHSIFADVGAGFFKEKKNRLNRTADKGYEQYYLWLAPGARYRFLDRFSVLGSFKLTLVENVKQTHPLVVPPVTIQARVEIPLFYRETETEAVRTLIFIEQNKEKDLAEEQGVYRTQSFFARVTKALNLPESGVALPDESRQQQVIEQRLKIQERILEIEKQVEDTE